MSFDQGRPDFLTNRPIEKFRWNPDKIQDVPTTPSGFVAQELASDSIGNEADSPVYIGYNTDAPYYSPLPFCRSMGGNDGYSTYMGGGGNLRGLLLQRDTQVGKIMLSPWRFAMSEEALVRKPVLYSQADFDEAGGMVIIDALRQS